MSDDSLYYLQPVCFEFSRPQNKMYVSNVTTMPFRVILFWKFCPDVRVWQCCGLTRWSAGLCVWRWARLVWSGVNPDSCGGSAAVRAQHTWDRCGSARLGSARFGILGLEQRDGELDGLGRVSDSGKPHWRCSAPAPVPGEVQRSEEELWGGSAAPWLRGATVAPRCGRWSAGDLREEQRRLFADLSACFQLTMCSQLLLSAPDFKWNPSRVSESRTGPEPADPPDAFSPFFSPGFCARNKKSDLLSGEWWYRPTLLIRISVLLVWPCCSRTARRILPFPSRARVISPLVSTDLRFWGHFSGSAHRLGSAPGAQGFSASPVPWSGDGFLNFLLPCGTERGVSPGEDAARPCRRSAARAEKTGPEHLGDPPHPHTETRSDTYIYI